MAKHIGNCACGDWDYEGKNVYTKGCFRKNRPSTILRIAKTSSGYVVSEYDTPGFLDIMAGSVRNKGKWIRIGKRSTLAESKKFGDAFFEKACASHKKRS